jgi:hypothetical protein
MTETTLAVTNVAVESPFGAFQPTESKRELLTYEIKSDCFSRQSDVGL